MLILTCQVDDSVYMRGDGVSGDIRVMVTSIKGDRVCIGIEAPQSVDILRSDVMDKMNARHKS